MLTADLSFGADGEMEDEDEEDMETSSADTGRGGGGAPYEGSCELAANTVNIQLDAVQQMLVGFLNSLTASSSTTLGVPPQAIISSRSTSSTKSSSTSSSKQPQLPLPTNTATSSSFNENKATLLSSLSTLQTLITEHQTQTSAREVYYRKQLVKERKRQSVWEESLRMVVQEGEMLENELRVRRRRRGSLRAGAGAGAVAIASVSGGRRGMRESVVGFGMGVDEVGVVQEGKEKAKAKEPPKREATIDTIKPTPTSPPRIQPPPIPPPALSIPTTPSPEALLEKEEYARAVEQAEEEEAEDSEDEFFDAIESNNIPNLIIPGPLSAPHTSPAYLPPYISTEPYHGYRTLRKALEL
jgi:hypothetical protein